MPPPAPVPDDDEQLTGMSKDLCCNQTECVGSRLRHVTGLESFISFQYMQLSNLNQAHVASAWLMIYRSNN